MTQLFNNTSTNRFELKIDGQIAFIDYRLEKMSASEWIYDLLHTEVPTALSGKGIGSRLVSETLEYIKAEGAMIRSRCSFISAYILRHPKYASIIAH